MVDKAEIIRTLKLLHSEGGITEVRALHASIGKANYKGTVSGYYNDFQKLAEDAEKIEAAGIYIIPNQINPALLSRSANRIRVMGKADSTTADKDVIRRRWLMIDADPERPAGISSSDPEHEEAIDRCRAISDYLMDRGWPASILADSGNGGHLLIPIDLPADDGGLVEKCLTAIANRFTDDVVKIDTTVHNPARIWKLYGTMARKGDHTEERPHRMAKLLEVPNV